jgi:hypothetical protein
VALVELKIIKEEAPLLYVMPATNNRATFPAPAVASPSVKFVLPLWVSVPVKPVQLTDLADTLPKVIVLVPRLSASKNTSSAAVGAAAPPIPPDVVAHFRPAVPSQVAVPPTQNLLAI